MRFPDEVATAEMGFAGPILQLFAYKNNLKDYIVEAGERDTDIARSAALADGPPITLMQAWQRYVNETDDDPHFTLPEFWRGAARPFSNCKTVGQAIGCTSSWVGCFTNLMCFFLSG